MSFAAHISSSIPATVDAPRRPAYFWTTLIILLAIDACVIVAACYLGTPVLDATLVGP